MAAKIMRGDLFALDFDALGHGVNVKGAMGAGIAVQFARRWPLMEQEYIERCRSGELKTGDFMAWTPQESEQDGPKIIYNLATQNNPGPDARTSHVIESVRGMVEHALGEGVRTIGIPMIGCGIGGADPREILDWLTMIGQRYQDVDLVIVVFGHEFDDVLAEFAAENPEVEVEPSLH